jgi:hypothetical protein
MVEQKVKLEMPEHFHILMSDISGAQQGISRLNKSDQALWVPAAVLRAPSSSQASPLPKA